MGSGFASFRSQAWRGPYAGPGILRKYRKPHIWPFSKKRKIPENYFFHFRFFRSRSGRIWSCQKCQQVTTFGPKWRWDPHEAILGYWSNQFKPFESVFWVPRAPEPPKNANKWPVSAPSWGPDPDEASLGYWSNQFKPFIWSAGPPEPRKVQQVTTFGLVRLVRRARAARGTGGTPKRRRDSQLVSHQMTPGPWWS